MCYFRLNAISTWITIFLKSMLAVGKNDDATYNKYSYFFLVSQLNYKEKKISD